MVVVAQSVRAPDCGSGGRGFDSHRSPRKSGLMAGLFYFMAVDPQAINS